MDKICKNCKYFLKDEDNNYGDCENAHFVYDETTPINGLMYVDYEGYAANFYVGEEFGCIHFERC